MSGPIASTLRRPRRGARAGRCSLSATALGCALGLLVALALPQHALGQDWGDDSDDWGTPESGGQSSGGWVESADAPWSFRAGLGFTVDPDDFLLTFELPYRFDRYVSVGPMVQVGLEDRRYLVAPTANLTIRVPDLPGDRWDRFHPLIFAGVGFAVIENDDRGGDTRQTGFLVNTGFGVEYTLSERVNLGSRMILNFLPSRTLDEKFFYAWEIGSVRLSF